MKEAIMMKFKVPDKYHNAWGAGPIPEAIEKINSLSEKEQKQLFRIILCQAKVVPLQPSIEDEIEDLPNERQKDIVLSILHRLL